MRQVEYLHEYLDKEWHPKTLVLEAEYVDGDYLGDYTSFYATAHAPFERFCRRIHFFIADFDDAQFQQYLLREAPPTAQEEFEQSYLGFAVARPLPQAIIGRTLLRTWAANPPSGAPRYYKAVLDYSANLFGLRLEIPKSLPFQQQDSVVAACATVALWSAFHKTADLFQTAAPQPAEITRMATTNLYQERIFPSSGLTVEQICDAIRANHLEPEVFRIDTHLDVPILSWLRSYLEFGIPLLLGIKLPADSVASERDSFIESESSGSEETPEEGKLETIRHAVTVVGYRAGEELVRDREAKAATGYEAPSVGRRIPELYCHDDNFGAFARYDVVTDWEGGNLRLRSDYQAGGKTADIEIESVIAPVYHKIRLPFPEMQKWVSLIDNALRGFIEADAYAEREWDVRLMGNGDFKEEIRQLASSRDTRLRLVTSAEPRFIWSAVLKAKETDIVRIYADATSIARSLPIRHIHFGPPELRDLVAAVLEEDEKPEAMRLRRHLIDDRGP